MPCCASQKNVEIHHPLPLQRLNLYTETPVPVSLYHTFPPCPINAKSDVRRVGIELKAKAHSIQSLSARHVKFDAYRLAVPCHQPESFALPRTEGLSQQQANGLTVKATDGCLTGGIDRKTLTAESNASQSAHSRWR